MIYTNDDEIYKTNGYSNIFQIKSALKEIKFPLGNSERYYVFNSDWIYKWSNFILCQTTTSPGRINNRKLLLEKAHNESSTSSEPFNKQRFILNPSLSEGNDFIVLPQNLALLLISIYGTDHILKTSKKHVLSNCDESETCLRCNSLWSNSNEKNIIEIYKGFQDYDMKYEEIKSRSVKEHSSISNSNEKDNQKESRRGCLFNIFFCKSF